MIVPMKKAFVITQSKDAAGAVKKLGEIGILHVEHQIIPQGPDINSLKEDLALIDNALLILSNPEFSIKAGFEKPKASRDWKALAMHVADSWKRLDQLEEYARNLASKINDYGPWGDFDPESIKKLAEKDIYVRLYEIPLAEMGKIPANVVVKKIFVVNKVAGCALISREKFDVPFTEIEQPKMSLQKMKSRMAEERKAIEQIRADILKHGSQKEALAHVKERLTEELKMQEALRGMAQAGELAYLAGYLPYDMIEKLNKTAKEEKWGLIIREPSEEDNTPTLIRNPKWITLIEPMFRLMEIVPGYREIDISPLFLLFLSLFFGMIIGDAGYGLLYILLTAFAQKKLGQRVKNTTIFALLYLFSASAVLWGILTGTVFGQEWYIAAGMKPVIPLLNDTKFIQAFCFFLGAFHLTLGQLWQGVRKLPSISVLSDLGWVMVLWASFFIARMLILDYPLPAAANWLVGIGVLLVIFFTNPGKNIFKVAGSGLGAVALSIMNNFTDVVSYVRLFAVGLAGVAISDTVNTLADAFGGGAWWARILILFLGHSINIVLGPISVLVHGVRLNVLEFSGHAGLTWSGTAYKPLKAD